MFYPSANRFFYPQGAGSSEATSNTLSSQAAPYMASSSVPNFAAINQAEMAKITSA